MKNKIIDDQMKKIMHGKPSGNKDHAFSFGTVDDFDEHIDKSVRGYSDLIRDVKSMAQYFITSDTKMIDVGCSTGKMLSEIENSNRESIPDVEYVGIECCENMIKNQIENSNISYFNDDVRNYKDWMNVSLVTSIFTLQFISHAARIPIVTAINRSLNDGGAFIFAEKVLSENSRVQDMLTFMHYDHKRKYFEDEDILDKEKSLRHMLRPCSVDGLVGLHSVVQRAGFSKIEPFWRNFNFVGYIAIK